ncbi:hypothetical protein CLV63_11530 [Murinocardiopsis flavida]|uniref:Uncharacterized protein n=1 Tax=Murinocardiopsis flavida TaxID=645275 RepID=A0A2P8DDS1_9ACTN|nr:hypothetical protein [Murinocardiopsis flavida]PSK95370.1 hypothetical protein CLV63_11530 [Murinocardiopsis flavida]
MGARPPAPPEPAHVLAELRAAEEAADGAMELLPGVDDPAMDAWEVPVPESVRRILRETGGLRTLKASGRTDEEFTVGHGANDDPGGPFYTRCGDPGTFRILHTNGVAETYYVDVDPAAGEWNGVLSLWDGLDARFEAPSLGHWLLLLAGAVRSAARAVRDGGFDHFGSAFRALLWGDFTAVAGTAGDPEHDWSAWRNPPEAAVIDATTARASTDPVLAQAGALLPDSATLADLRGATRRTYVPVIRHPAMDLDAAFHRFHGGGVLAAVPWDE